MSLATPEKTKEYALKFDKFSEDFFNIKENLYFSSLGVGTYVPEPYKEENYTFSFKNSIKEAILNGSNVIDCASNFRYGQSEREIGEAIRELKSENQIERESLILSTKVGFVQLDFPFPKNPYHWIEDNIIKPKRATKEQVFIDQYCLEPEYLKWSFERSLKNMGVDGIDILYLHNPEFALGHITYQELLEKIEQSFILFEELKKEGKINFYGVASWNSFLFENDNLEYISIKDLVNIARKIDAKGFKFIQMPYNLAKTHAFNYTNQPADDELFYSPLQIAKKYNLNIIGSSSLLQMNLFKKPFSQTVTKLLGKVFVSDIQKALQFARSAPDITTALFSSKEPTHIKHNLELAHIPKTPSQNYMKIFNL